MAAVLEATLVKTDGTIVKLLWKHTLEPNRELTIAQVQGTDDGRGGLVDLGVNLPGVPEHEFRNVSGRGYHALVRFDGQQLHVQRRLLPKPTTNGLLTTRGEKAPDLMKLNSGEGFRIARFQFNFLVEAPPPNAPIPSMLDEPSNRPVAVTTKEDLEVSIAPIASRSFKRRGPNEVARNADEVLRTDLVKPDELINGLLDIVDRFDPSQPQSRLDQLFQAAIRRTLSLPDAMADVIDVPVRGEPKPRGADRLAFFSRSFVRDAIDKVSTSGGVLAGLWRGDNVRADDGHSSPDMTGSPRRSGMTPVASLVRSGSGAGTAQSGWAVCAPVPMKSSGDRVVLYVSAPLDTDGSNIDIQTDPNIAQAQKVVLFFAKLYAALDRMGKTDSRLREAMTYLPKPVQRLMSKPDYEAKLAARPLNVTVLFCDLRGSCGVAESGGADLKNQWDTVFQDALEQMSRAIDENGGVIGGFIGDAVMGFWGWPEALSPENQVPRAVKAALSIRQNFERLRQRPRSPLAGLRIGIGITHGLALVGRLGNYDMKKIDVFGPTVNRAARLEGMTKKFGVEILADEWVAQHLGEDGVTSGHSLNTAAGGIRAKLRRLVRVSPAGMEEPFDVYEVTADDDLYGGSDAVSTNYADALAEFENGSDWSGAVRTLDRLVERDAPSRFLRDLLAGQRSAPNEWPRDGNGRCYVKLTDK